MRKYWLAVPLVLLALGCSKKEEPKPEGLHIAGTIQIDPSLAKYAQDSDTLFLIARPAEGGPPLAVQKLTGKNYPYSFTLTQADLMIPRDDLDVPLDLSVRVDKDGDPMTKNPGDLVGTYEKNPVSIHSDGIVITVKERLK